MTNKYKIKNSCKKKIINKNTNENLLNLLNKTIKIGRSPIHSTTKWWSQTIDHKIIALLAITSKLNILPLDFTMNYNQRNCVAMRIVHNLCTSSHSTIQKIITDGVNRGDLIQIKPTSGDKRYSLFTASENLLEVFIDEVN